MSEEVKTNPLQAERTDTIEAAVSKLLQEPEQSAPPTEEPEDTAEPLEEAEEQPADETPEDEVEPVEGESDEEEGEYEEEEETEGEEDALDYYVVKLDGEEVEVSIDELQSGYQRQKDYTKKTQALAEQRKAYEAKAAEIEQLQEQYLQQAQLANQLLNRDLEKFKSLDWETMKTEDPVGYLQKQIEVQDIQKQQAHLHQQAQLAYEHNQKVQAEEQQQYLEMQRKEALTLFPDWSDSEKQAVHKQDLITYATKVGYTDQELNSLTNAKDLATLDKAMKYDKMMETKKGIAKKSTTPAIRKRVKRKGVAPKGTQQVKVQQEKSDALRKSGSLKDAAALMYEMRTSKQIKLK